ncbi:MAG: hypothetical protein DRR16_03170 [Candidatus Parabeggiatoa sp. nov. 3]|nr:MAG: hypothetical protein DRR00_01010 [Gammaproteobacteria bacterium]RKZ66820.1 MAG: hypothetical protein DRQ99_08490 [Gammaproteobacteria bacterium]RKZ89166.1 MAG: hypothetical protein DRR16_03170 [Gammaproteobacteria bacterium]
MFENIILDKHIVVASHRRSGTHLTIDALKNNFQQYNNMYVSITEMYKNRHNPKFISESRNLLRSSRIIKMHSHGNIEAFYGDCPMLLDLVIKLLSSKIIYVYRDGRDVLTSLYFYTKKFAPEFFTESFKEFIRATNNFDAHTYHGEMNRVEYWQYHLKTWFEFNRNKVFYVSFEDLVKNYSDTLLRISSFLELPLSDNRIDVRISSASSSNAKINSNHEFCSTSVYFRKGVIGDYKNLFSKEDFDFFYSIT